VRVVFFGTPSFAVASLEALAVAGHTIAGVVTQPDRPRGRGQHVQPPDVKVAATALGLTILQPLRLRTPEFAAAIAGLDAELGVVAAYCRILPPNILRTPPLGMINVHASLLPRWRGAAPVQRAILAGDRDTGVTIMRVVEALDAGPILAREATTIEPDETSRELEHRLAHLGAHLLVRTIVRLAFGDLVEVPQREESVTYASRIEKRESPVNWARPALAVHNQIRGLQPWPQAATRLDGMRVLLRKSTALPGHAHASAPGTILSANAAGVLVAAGSGAVQLLELQLAGRPPVSAAAFLNGHPLRSGDSFESAPDTP
jgi:methionyl-tRNA formyltransferase